jgi:hypothetical protein
MMFFCKGIANGHVDYSHKQGKLVVLLTELEAKVKPGVNRTSSLDCRGRSQINYGFPRFRVFIMDSRQLIQIRIRA